jgi:Ca2+-binding EF-hand superfamily protein
MSNEFIDRHELRIVKTFDTLDGDGDGMIDRSDFVLLAERMYERVSGYAGEEHHDAIQAAALSWWEQLSGDLDVNNDGRITKREYVTS